MFAAPFGGLLDARAKSFRARWILIRRQGVVIRDPFRHPTIRRFRALLNRRRRRPRKLDADGHWIISRPRRPLMREEKRLVTMHGYDEVPVAFRQLQCLDRISTV